MNHFDKAEDPDPLTIAFGLVGVASLTLQLRDKYKSRRERAFEMRRVAEGERTVLVALDQSTRDLDSAIQDVVRVIEYGVRDSEDQFFNSPIRVGKTVMYIADEYQTQYKTSVMNFYAKIGQFSNWVHHTLFGHEALAEEVGKYLAEDLTDIQDELNNLLAEGGPTRDALLAARKSLAAMENAVRQILLGRN